MCPLRCSQKPALPLYNKVDIYDKNIVAEIRVILSQGKGTSYIVNSCIRRYIGIAVL